MLKSAAGRLICACLKSCLISAPPPQTWHSSNPQTKFPRGRRGVAADARLSLRAVAAAKRLSLLLPNYKFPPPPKKIQSRGKGDEFLRASSFFWSFMAKVNKLPKTSNNREGVLPDFADNFCPLALSSSSIYAPPCHGCCCDRDMHARLFF